MNWQSNEMMHPLTCNCGNNTPLNIIEINLVYNRVSLRCKDCGLIQEWIPKCVIDFSEKDVEELKEMVAKLQDKINDIEAMKAIKEIKDD